MMPTTKPLLLITIFILVAFQTSCCIAQSPQKPTAGEEAALKDFMKEYFVRSSPRDVSTQYKSAFVDLNDERTLDAVVYITGNDWCGTGGCRLLVLAPSKASYKVISETTITRPPIRVLASKTNGWHDLGVWVQGGGILPGYEAKLPFNGSSYPTNPTLPPAEQVNKKSAGRVLIPAAQ